MLGLDKEWLNRYGVDANQIAGLIPFSGQMISHFAYRKMNGIDNLQPTIDKYAPLFYVRKDAAPLILITGDRNIELLQVRASKPGDMTIHSITLPQQVCFCHRYQCKDVAEATKNLHDTYIAAAKTGHLSMIARMFTMRMSPDCDVLDLMCCIPVDNSFAGEERVEFAETPALCIYFRGAYEDTGKAIRALTKHVKENNICVAGPFRSIYLEGPPNRGNKTADYITQIAVPIKL